MGKKILINERKEGCGGSVELRDKQEKRGMKRQERNKQETNKMSITQKTQHINKQKKTWLI